MQEVTEITTTDAGSALQSLPYKKSCVTEFSAILSWSTKTKILSLQTTEQLSQSQYLRIQ